MIIVAIAPRQGHQMQENQSIVRAIALLRQISQPAAIPSVGNLAATIGVSAATASRMLGTLEREGFVERVRGGTFRLGAELARLGQLADRNALLLDRIEPFLQQLSSECRETVTVSVKSADGQVDVIRQIHGPHFIGDHNWIGLRPPDHATSNGKIFLSELPEDSLERELQGPLERFTASTITSPRRLRDELAQVRRQGFATLVNELEEGLAGISVPLRDTDGSLLLVITVSGPSYRFDESARTRALASLRATVRAIQESATLQLSPEAA
jgi:DNA-binding IclR family transcriptional regulator